MSSFLYPDSATRKLINEGRCNPKTGRPYTAARRRTAEHFAKMKPVEVEKSFVQKVKSRVSNFLKSLWS